MCFWSQKGLPPVFATATAPVPSRTTDLVPASTLAADPIPARDPVPAPSLYTDPTSASAPTPASDPTLVAAPISAIAFKNIYLLMYKVQYNYLSSIYNTFFRLLRGKYIW